MPPTMILTCGVPAADVAAVRESRQPVRATSASPATPAASRRVLTFMTVSVQQRGWEGSGPDLGGSRGWAPGQQPAFEPGQQPLGEQREDSHDDHAGVDAGRVEGALRLVDQQSETLVGAGVLAEDRKSVV